ncbi:hypothetical protein D3C78_1906100 [compost metagenome]
MQRAHIGSTLAGNLTPEKKTIGSSSILNIIEESLEKRKITFIKPPQIIAEDKSIM